MFELKDSGRHLVMRKKLLNDAGVAAESPPSQHEQISDLSQVIRSVGVELNSTQRDFGSNCLSAVSAPIRSKSAVLRPDVPTWCSNAGRLSGVYSKVKQLSSSLCMMSAGG